MYKRFCNICGKEFDFWDEQEDFSIVRNVGYGSKFDGSSIHLDMCCGCFDSLLESLIKECAISPVSGDDELDHITYDRSAK